MEVVAGGVRDGGANEVGNDAHGALLALPELGEERGGKEREERQGRHGRLGEVADAGQERGKHVVAHQLERVSSEVEARRPSLAPGVLLSSGRSESVHCQRLGPHRERVGEGEVLDEAPGVEGRDQSPRQLDLHESVEAVRLIVVPAPVQLDLGSELGGEVGGQAVPDASPRSRPWW